MSIDRNRLHAPRAAHCLLLVLVLPWSALAQTQLDPVVVTGTREPELLSRSTADIVVIDSATIRNTSADSVEDLLRRFAGIQLARNGGPGQSTGFFIRGSSTSGSVVMIDGVRIGSASLGQAELENLSLAQIDHIEILRGPASSLYGADAVGGVVQIFTQRGEGGPRVAASLAIGGYGSWLSDVNLSGASGGLDYAVTAGRDSSHGVSAIRPNDAFGNFNSDRDGYARDFGNLRLGYTPAPGQRIGLVLLESRLNSQYDGAEFNPPDFAPDPSPDFRNHMTNKVASIDYRGVLSPAWTTTLQIAGNIDDLQSGGARLSDFKTSRTQATWQNAVDFGAGQQLMLAYEYLHEEVRGESFPDRPKHDNNALVFGYNATFEQNRLEASVRFDDNSVYGSVTTGRLGWSWQALPSLKLRALAGSTFRAPTFNDLFLPGFGVASIQPERGHSVEVGVEWQSAGTTAAATLYRNTVDDLIGFQPDRSLCPPAPGFDFGCAANTSRARLQGLTLSGIQRWGGLSARATIDLLDATDLDTGVRLPRRAAQQETLAADYDASVWSAGASLLFVGSRPDFGVVLGGYAVLDLRAAWRFQPQWRLEAKLLNALDKDVEPVRDYQGLGRQAWIGIRFDGKGL